MELKIGGTYRHKKTGGKYEAEGRMKLQISPETLLRAAPFVGGEVVAKHFCDALERMTFVSYSSKVDDNQIFGRPESEFLDGRFEDITPINGWMLQRCKDGSTMYYKAGGSHGWKSTKQEATLYSGEDFALRDRANLFKRSERKYIEVIKAQQDPS